MEEIYKRISNEDDFGPDDTEKSEIQEFFRGQTVLLTGCTGFLGKCFVEKLLRSCPGIKKLYLIVRPLKVSPTERIKKYFEHYFFDQLRKWRPNFMSKVAIIEGDLLKNNLGISEEDRNIILNDVTLIIHNASNVKFEVRVSTSLRCNVLGTKYMLDLAKECKKLKCFSYISTAYSHCYNRFIEEKCYPPPANLKMVQDFIDADEHTPNGVTNVARDEACRPWPNIYTFGKATAESLVEQCATEVSFSCIIFRPSMVVSTYQEPIPAWSGNINGPAPAFLGTGLGVLHMLLGDDYVQDWVPADMCANALYSIIWDVNVNRKENIGSVLVFNYGSSTVNQMTAFKLSDVAVPHGREAPSTKMIGPHFVGKTSCFWYFCIAHFFLHFLPAVLADIVLLVTFHKPVCVGICYRITANLPRILYFFQGNWRIFIRETTQVWDRMNKRDSFLFFNDLRTLDWTVWGWPYWFGMRIYCLHDPITTVPAGLRRYYMIQGTFLVLRALAVAYISYRLFKYWLFIISPVINYTILQICNV